MAQPKLQRNLLLVNAELPSFHWTVCRQSVFADQRELPEVTSQKER